MANQLVKDKVKYLKFGKEKLPILISFRTLKVLKDQYKLDVEQIDSLESLETILKVSYNSGCRALEQEPKYKTEEDFLDILDVTYLQFTKLMAGFFEVPEIEEDKKK